MQSDHNLFFGSGALPVGFSNSLKSNPMFVNSAAFNFQLQTRSPAIDAAIMTTAITDFLGMPRPQNGAYDLGVYEFIF